MAILSGLSGLGLSKGRVTVAIVQFYLSSRQRQGTVIGVWIEEIQTLFSLCQAFEEGLLLEKIVQASRVFNTIRQQIFRILYSVIAGYKRIL